MEPTILAELESRRAADHLAQAFAGEVEARYDALTGTWRYERDGENRILMIQRNPKGLWRVLLNKAEREGGE